MNLKLELLIRATQVACICVHWNSNSAVPSNSPKLLVNDENATWRKTVPVIRLDGNRCWRRDDVQGSPCFRSDNTIRNKAVSSLKGTHCGLCFWSEIAVYNNSNLCLHLLHLLPGRGTAKRRSTGGSPGFGWRLNCRDQSRGRSCSAHDRSNGCS